ncbi:odorant receptor 50 [Apis mellifera caucasica]|nr:odorant receptor 50 [Apis mellifera caucasica]
MLGTQFLSAFVVSSSASASFTLATIFTCHVLGQLNIMMIWINEFVDRLQRKENKDNHINKIGVIVEHHLRILSLIARIERITCPIYFMELFKCMMGMCMPSYYFLAEWSERNIQNLTIYVMVALSMSFNILLVCCIGEILREQCKKVGDMCGS